MNEIVLKQFLISFSNYVSSSSMVTFDRISGVNNTDTSNVITLLIRLYVPEDQDQDFIDDFVIYVANGYFQFALRKKHDVLSDVFCSLLL